MARLDRRTQLNRSRGLSLAPLRGEALASTAPEVYVVEGDLSVRASLVWLLNSFGIGVLAFASPADFLRADFLREVHAAQGCIIFDVELRGVERLVGFANELRQRGLVLPIVATSADPFVSAEEVHRAGAIAFLPKPFASDALLDGLRAAKARSAALAS